MSASEPVLLGIIGGTSVYNIEGISNLTEVRVDTPFGTPSDAIMVGELEGMRVAFLARHGRGHGFTPSEVPFRANIWALKSIGVKYLLSVSAVGSLAIENKPTDVVLPTQFLDRTRLRKDTFFGEGCVAHIAFAHPVCPNMHQVLHKAASGILAADKVHPDGTYVVIEGPAFSTVAESRSYIQLGGSIIGMTAFPEAKLAREAEMAYAMLALVTDYDCWHQEHAHVTVDMVMANLKQCGGNAQKIIRSFVQELKNNGLPSSDAHSALQFAIMTPKEKVPQATREKLDLFTKKYWQ